MPMQEINELRDSFVDNLLPVKIYLFGSIAEGKDNEDSDFDFYIEERHVEEAIRYAEAFVNWAEEIVIKEDEG